MNIQDYLDIIAYVFAGLGLLSLLIDIYTSRNSEVIDLYVTECKNKRYKSKRYSYPKVMFDSGKEVHIRHAQKRGYDRYYEGQAIPFYDTGFFNKNPRCKIGFYYRTYSIFTISLIAYFVYYFQ